MKLTIVTRPPAKAEVFAFAAPEGGEPWLGESAPEAAKAARKAAGRNGFRGKPGTSARAGIEGSGGRIAVVHGLGPEADLDPSRLSRWAQKAAQEAARDGFRHLCLVLPEHEILATGVGSLEIQRGLRLSSYRFGRHSEKPPGGLESVALLAAPDLAKALRKQRRTASLIADACELARDLANTPPNEAHPEWMAAQARKLARSRELKVRVLTPTQLERKGMGGILAVGGGSERAPRLVRLEWGSGPRTIAIVGKGVTFDTGGISIKPAAAMDEMKFDKSGACVALGVAQGAADLDLPFRFRVYVPLAENMPDGRAYRPGDIVRCYNGKTVEILNTDAEGRMILADAMAWASEEQPDVLIDYATLTGAVVVALGNHGAGLFASHDGLASELLAAGEATGERLWRLPLWPEYLRDMKGRHADLKNTGSRWGGAATAAAFLSEFVDGVEEWAHLDIAGTAWVGSDQSGSFGSTAFGVALTLIWLLRQAGRLDPAK